MKIYIGSDHAGFELKEKLVEFLRKEKYEVIDRGAYRYDKWDDYPEFSAQVAEAVSANPKVIRGIILDESGQGGAMVANRFSNVRAAVFYGSCGAKNSKVSQDVIKFSREHNDSNILSLGTQFLKEDEAKKMIKLWLETSFSGAVRHKRRISKIDDIAQKKICTTVAIRTNLLGSGKFTKPPKKK